MHLTRRGKRTICGIPQTVEGHGQFPLDDAQLAAVLDQHGPDAIQGSVFGPASTTIRRQRKLRWNFAHRVEEHSTNADGGSLTRGNVSGSGREAESARLTHTRQPNPFRAAVASDG